MKRMDAYPKEYFYKKIVAAKLYMDENYSKGIDVGNIASEAFFSKFDFIRQFKKTYKLTPYNYLKRVRLQKATELLQSSEQSVKEVCSKVGYDSVSSFTGLFKRKFGLPPKRYQKEYQKRADLIRDKPLEYVPGCFAENKGWKKSNFEEVRAPLKC